MASKTPSRSGNRVKKGIGEEPALNKSSREVDFGNVIWVQLDGHWWLGQVVDEKTVGGKRKPSKKLDGQVLIRLYGSYKYLYVDPMRSQLEYEKIIEKYHSSHIDILGEALKQDLRHLESGSTEMEDIKSKGGVKVPAFTAAIEAHLQRITEAVLDHALHICSTKNVKTEVQVLIGDPKEKICDAVEDMHADLLVMGTCSFGPVKRMFSGSVSNFCSNYAQCPVIIVNASS